MPIEPIHAHFARMARYNRRANEILYATCALLTDTERKQDRRAFFRSIHGTLNHILVGDRIWLARFEGRPPPTSQLDLILYEEFEPLRAARVAEDEHIEQFIAGLDPAQITADFAYRSIAGEPRLDPLAVLLAHLFNHQTHHRGQVHDMIGHTAVPPPSLDLHRLLLP